MKSLYGISLLEMLVTLSLLSTLLAVAQPGFSTLLQRTKSEAMLRKLASTIQFAKSSAISNGQLVTICRSANGNACGGKWREGVMLFTDANADGKVNEDDNILRYVSFPNAAGDIDFRAFQNKQFLQVTGLGFTRSQNGNFTYCPDNGQASLANQLIINRTARLRYAADTNGDGLREDSRGRPIRCK